MASASGNALIKTQVEMHSSLKHAYIYNGKKNLQENKVELNVLQVIFDQS